MTIKAGQQNEEEEDEEPTQAFIRKTMTNELQNSTYEKHSRSKHRERQNSSKDKIYIIILKIDVNIAGLKGNVDIPVKP